MDLERRKEILDQLLKSGEISSGDYEIMFTETIERHLLIENTESKVYALSSIVTPPLSIKEPSNVSDLVVQNILNALCVFEQNYGFLTHNITLGVLAGHLKTNSKYLSRIINLYKKKSYTQYINDLRIEYAIEQLKNNPVFFQYTIKAIAQEIGFNTSEAFSKAFLKKTGMYPSQYINELTNMR